MRRLLLIVLAAIIAFPILTATPADAACSTSLRLTLYENPNYGSQGTDPFVRCASIPNLNDMSCCTAWDDQDCLAPLIRHYNWNDCASSWKFVGNCHYGVTLYADGNYGGTVVWSTWGTKSFSGGFGREDMVSSFRWNYRATCPSSTTP